MTPRQIGKYEIVEKIGEGGFGRVYKAWDPFIKRHLAIKTCTSSDESLRRRYYLEAEIAGRLDHPYIVRIFDFGVDGETPFLVQEFLPGADLDHKIGSGEFLPYPERVLYLIEIARGLEYAHRQGVVHRDIKPGNIRILDDGTVKIMDFGVAMLQGAETRLTRDGTTVGTAAYLAPEQIQGKAIDRRTDIFSYGVLAYELLTGRQPFTRESISATFFSILHDEPSRIDLPTTLCPQALAELVFRCLAKKPEDRIDDFAQVLDALDLSRRQMQLQARSAPALATGRMAARATVVGSAPHETDRGKARSDTFPPAVDLPLRTAPPVILRSAAASAPRRQPGLLAALTVLALAGSYSGLARQGIVPGIDDLSRTDPQSTASAKRDRAVFEAAPRFETADASATASWRSASSSLGSLPDPPLPATEPPAISIVRLPAGWSPGIIVTVDDGPSLDLANARKLTLSPGPHQLEFSFRDRGYHAVQTVDVHLEAGDDRTLRIPIRPPGELTVQASLGSPQGVVTIDGQALGHSPLRAFRLQPGTHRIEISALHAPSVPLAATTLEVSSLEETVVTFDLTGRRELTIRSRRLTG